MTKSDIKTFIQLGIILLGIGSTINMFKAYKKEVRQSEVKEPAIIRGRINTDSIYTRISSEGDTTYYLILK